MNITDLEIVSFGGHAINDGTNFKAHFPMEMPPLSDSEIQDVQRDGVSPIFASKRRMGKVLSLSLEVFAGNIADLMAWFDPYDGGKQALVVKDTANSNKQWYVEAVTVSMPQFELRHGLAQLYVDDPVWRSVTEASTVWNITASGQTKALTNNGNANAFVRLDIEPTSAKTGDYYKYRQPVRAYHENAARLAKRALAIPLNTSALVNDTSVSNQINQGGGISDSDMSIPIDTAVGGGLNANGGMCYVDSEQIKYTGISGGVMTVATGGRGWGGTTAAIHADNAVMSRSLCRADGNDLRVYSGGVELDRWLYGMNTTTTVISTEGLDFEKDSAMTLQDSIAGTGAVTGITVKNTLSNRRKLALLDPAGGLVEVVTGGTPEVFVYSGRDLITRTITVEDRAARGTSMAAHSAGDTVRWRQFDLWIYYGRTDADAPEVSESKRPACDSNWDNETLVFSEFGNRAGTRPFTWKLAVLASTSKKSKFYTGNHRENANPMTELGLSLICIKKNGVWRSEEGTVAAQFYDPGGIYSVAGSGEKYRVRDWADVVEIQKSQDGIIWETVSAISSPSSASNWASWSVGTTVLGSGYKFVRLLMDGDIRGNVANNATHCEADTMTIVLDNPVSVSVGTRETQYDLDCEFEVQETGDILSLTWSMLTGETLYVNSAARTILHEDGTNAYRAKSLNTRRIQWLAIPPGNSTLVFRETGATGLTVTAHYEERNL